MILNDNMRVEPNPGFVLKGRGGPDEETFEYAEKDNRIQHKRETKK